MSQRRKIPYDFAFVYSTLVISGPSFHETFPKHILNFKSSTENKRRSVFIKYFKMQIQKGFDLIPKYFDNLNEKSVTFHLWLPGYSTPK